MKIAIASSGLGHVARGIETWALDTAVALHQWAATCAKATAAKVDSEQLTVGKGANVEVTLFCAAELPSAVHRPPSTIVLPCLKRGDRRARFLARLMPGFTWRWGWKSAYSLEQQSFWRYLWPILRDENYDILHVQDPLLADLCRRYRLAGKLRTKEILAHGTEEPVEFLEKFDYVQHLAPWHLEQTEKKLGEKKRD